MSNAPNLPPHVGYCQCDDCFVQVPSDVELCGPCRSAGCDVEGGPCKAESEKVEVLRHQTSQAGLELASYGFAPMHQGGGLVNFQGKTPDGRTVRIISGEGDGWGPDRLDEPVDVFTATDAADDDYSIHSFDSLNAYLNTLPRPS